MARPVISYPGAKWRFYQHIKPYIPRDTKVWIEPFFGGGSMSLSVADDPSFSKIERMIGGDLAPEIWALWVGIRDNPDDVMEISKRWFDESCPHHKEIQKINRDIMLKYVEKEDIDIDADDTIDNNTKQYIREARELYNLAIEEGRKFWDWTQNVDCESLSIPERAARTYLVNRISFSGMGDSGSLSKQRFSGFNYGMLSRISEASPLLKRMELYNVSFEETMKYGNDDPEHSFIFLDPPYYKQEESGLYGKDGDTHRGFPHEHFAEFTKSMKCKWFVTYDDSVKVRRMFRGKTALGNRCTMVPFTIPGGYTMAVKASEDALAGEELFIANYNIKDMNNLDLADL